MIHILALLARAGHGKTTIANYLRDTYGAQVVSLAAPLKRAAKKVMAFSDSQLYGTQTDKEAIDPRYGISARTFLQRLGTEGLREEFGPDVHIRALFHQIERHDDLHEGHYVYVVDDVRFPNEVAAIVNAEQYIGACVKLICEDAPAGAGDHASERGIDLVPSEHIAATVIGSRAKGQEAGIAAFEAALRNTPRLAPIRRMLDESRATLERVPCVQELQACL